MHLDVQDLKNFYYRQTLGACGTARDPNAVAGIMARCNGTNRCGIRFRGSFAASVFAACQTRHRADARATGCYAVARQGSRMYRYCAMNIIGRLKRVTLIVW